MSYVKHQYQKIKIPVPYQMLMTFKILVPNQIMIIKIPVPNQIMIVMISNLN